MVAVVAANRLTGFGRLKRVVSKNQFVPVFGRGSIELLDLIDSVVFWKGVNSKNRGVASMKYLHCFRKSFYELKRP